MPRHRSVPTYAAVTTQIMVAHQENACNHRVTHFNHLERFSIECRKQFAFVLVLLYFAN